MTHVKSLVYLVVVMVHSFNPSTGGQRKTEFWELAASLVCIVRPEVEQGGRKGREKERLVFFIYEENIDQI